MHFLVWPASERGQDDKTQSGVMHAKCAVADGDVLFVSSANLTEHALRANMEIGLLVRQRDVAKAVERHFNALVGDGILVPLDETQA